SPPEEKRVARRVFSFQPRVPIVGMLFKSLLPRQKTKNALESAFFISAEGPHWGRYSNPSLPAKD
ncbi:MAG: hypothetical protein ACOYZ6_14875, partial [Chloroflexota bacterium]